MLGVLLALSFAFNLSYYRAGFKVSGFRRLKWVVREFYEVLVSFFIKSALATLFLVNCCYRQLRMDKVGPDKSGLLNLE